MISSIEIRLEYRLLGRGDWDELPMTAADYFDTEYMSEENGLDIDDVPLHDHAIDYLDVDYSLVANTRLTIIDNKDGKRRIIVETFWHGGSNRIIERTDEHHGTEDYWEMIIDSQAVDEGRTNEIMRIGREDGIFVLLSHVFISTAADGSQTESKVYPID
jgi:hypothetical protein